MRKNKFYSILAWIILIIIVIGILGLTGAGVAITLKLIGIQYRSIKDLIIFMIMLFIISIPLDILIQALPKALYKSKRIKEENILNIRYPLDFMGNLFAIIVIDSLIETVELSFIPTCLFSLILCFVNYKLSSNEDLY